QEKRRAHRVSILGGIFRSFLVIIPSALLMATILSWWTNPQFLQPGVRAGLQAAIIASGITPSPTIFVPTPNWLSRIGIVSGHNGPRPDGSPVDPGATCENASGETYLTEREVNFDVATRVVVGLRSLGYSVDLMDEFDPRLANYQGAALVSIHSNTCRDFGEVVSGYLVAKAEARPENGVDTLLADCITRYYGAHTRMPQHFGVTEDMTDYHSFREIHPSTPAAIIELGFLRADQEMLTKHQDELAAGIVDGIRCFIDPQFDLQNAPPTGTVLPGAPDGTPGDATLTGDTAAETLEGTPPQP
ncbi:MAG TPA: N-acetylmuramoyl-L-alanine amidase, partial [Phototrophicaceae bacterium]|nr:N-acetylmuramoyl-L-alanine amidase [Phototrophicaceae bacterium]